MINTPQGAMRQNLQMAFISLAVVLQHQSRCHNFAPSWHEVVCGTTKNMYQYKYLLSRLCMILKDRRSRRKRVCPLDRNKVPQLSALQNALTGLPCIEVRPCVHLQVQLSRESVFFSFLYGLNLV